MGHTRRIMCKYGGDAGLSGLIQEKQNKNEKDEVGGHACMDKRR